MTWRILYNIHKWLYTWRYNRCDIENITHISYVQVNDIFNMNEQFRKL